MGAVLLFSTDRILIGQTSTFGEGFSRPICNKIAKPLLKSSKSLFALCVAIHLDIRKRFSQSPDAQALN